MFAARFELPFGQVVRCHVTAILRPCRFRGISLATRDRQRAGKWVVGVWLKAAEENEKWRNVKALEDIFHIPAVPTP